MTILDILGSSVCSRTTRLSPTVDVRRAVQRRGTAALATTTRRAARTSIFFAPLLVARRVQGCLQQVCCSANVLAMQLASATAQNQSRSVAGRQSALLPAADVANMQPFALAFLGCASVHRH